MQEVAGGRAARCLAVSMQENKGSDVLDLIFPLRLRSSGENRCRTTRHAVFTTPTTLWLYSEDET